jgi:hypothetical protein
LVCQKTVSVIYQMLNGVLGHAILFCMSDATEGGAPCDYSVPTDALHKALAELPLRHLNLQVFRR